MNLDEWILPILNIAIGVLVAIVIDKVTGITDMISGMSG